MKTIIALILMTTANVVWADCQYNGKSYPVGTKLGALVCTPKGWR
jgi:hypothetical protein